MEGLNIAAFLAGYLERFPVAWHTVLYRAATARERWSVPRSLAVAAR